MKAIGSVIGAPFKALGLISTPPKPLAPLPVATRDDAAAASARDDELRRRRGSAADQLLGPLAGEAAGVSVKALTGE
jgi:hypothetical protein